MSWSISRKPLFMASAMFPSSGFEIKCYELESLLFFFGFRIGVCGYVREQSTYCRQAGWLFYRASVFRHIRPLWLRRDRHRLRRTPSFCRYLAIKVEYEHLPCLEVEKKNWKNILQEFLTGLSKGLLIRHPCIQEAPTLRNSFSHLLVSLCVIGSDNVWPIWIWIQSSVLF